MKNKYYCAKVLVKRIICVFFCLYSLQCFGKNEIDKIKTHLVNNGYTIDVLSTEYWKEGKATAQSVITSSKYEDEYIAYAFTSSKDVYELVIQLRNVELTELYQQDEPHNATPVLKFTSKGESHLAFLFGLTSAKNDYTEYPCTILIARKRLGKIQSSKSNIGAYVAGALIIAGAVAAVDKVANIIASSPSSPSYSSDIDPDRVSIPSIQSMSDWYKESILDRDAFWAKDIVWTDGTRGKIRIYNYNYATDDIVYYKSELDAINAEYVSKKFHKTRSVGKGTHSYKAVP